jgi:hypothetical protein
MNAPEKINWTPELLAECRNEKGVVLGMMSEEARRALIANKDHAETYFRSREWTDIKNVEIWPIDSWHHAYRLSPSYTPPELEPKPYVDCPVMVCNGCAYSFIRNNEVSQWYLSDAVDFADFAGFVYEGGAVCTACRLPGLKEGPFSAPIAVRFWTGTGGAK